MINNEDEMLKNLLLSEKILNEDQVVELEEEFNRTGRLFTEILVDYEILDSDQLMAVIATHLGTGVVNLTDLEIEKEYIDLLDSNQARMYGAIPVGEDEDGSLKVVCNNPLNFQIADELHFILDKNIRIYVAKEGQLANALEKYYPAETMNEMFSGMDLELAEAVEEDWDTEDLEAVANDTPIVRFVDVVLYQAIKDQASDIHFEPFENSFKIRYRLDGVLYEMAPPPKNLAIPVVSRIKIMSGLNIAERRVPQDGRIQVRVAGKKIDLRVSTIPTQYGESVVLRVLDRTIVNLDLESLGFEREVLQQLKDMISLPNGIFIVTGPTGSGKTTTLYSALKEVNKISEKILTAEDPVEYDLDGIMQLPIHETIGMTFARALRAFLRQDPDIIMVGEIRDLETAQMAIQASLTGHLVFSTLHTKEAAGALTRLIDMGVEPFLLNSSLIGVLAQRLIRRICTFCKTEYLPTDDDLELLGLTRKEVGDRKFYYGKGCSKCNNIGYKGRKAIIELMKITPEINELVSSMSPTITLRDKAKEQGMITLREDAIRTVFNGESTIEEVVKYITMV
jgi:type IV pilus assembly protein PilB